MGLVIGTDNFGKVVRNKYDFVDKSLFIKDVFDDTSEVLLITRPRRFGKTLNLSMLHHFLAPDIDGQETHGLFDGLKISKAHKQYMEHQGKYPVIFITFREVKDSGFKEAYKQLCLLIQECYKQHRYLLTSPKLYKEDKEYFELAVEGKLPDHASLKISLKNLTYYLYQHHGVKPWVLIDEYDTPIQESYMHKYYDEMISIMRGLLGSALKSNRYLNKAVVTGILRVAKESIFSGLNNLKVYSILNSKYSQYFGFTEDEVLDLLKRYKLEDKFKEVKKWYDGYCFGSTNVYNPWSIVNCIEDKQFIPYWVNTGNMALIKTLLAKYDVDVITKFESILKGKSIDVLVDENMVFDELYNNENYMWSLLLSSGYLNASSCKLEDYGIRCSLKSPNKEVNYIYKKIVREWFTTGKLNETKYNKFLNSLIEGRVDEFYENLKRFLLESSSMFDSENRNPEKFYHGFVLGLIVSLNESHIVKSNHESGYGKYDVMLIPKDKSKLGIILEFKVAEGKLSLEKEAKTALNQIEERQYETEMRQNGVNNILKLGLAFRGKEVVVLQGEN